MTTPAMHNTGFFLARKASGNPKVEFLSSLTGRQHRRLSEACARLHTHAGCDRLFAIAVANHRSMCSYLDGVVATRPLPPTLAVQGEVTRVVMNFVATFGTFLEHISLRTEGELGPRSAGRLRSLLTAERGASFSHRLCRQLRNHALHQGLTALRVTLRSAIMSIGAWPVSRASSAQDLHVHLLVAIDRDVLLQDPKLSGSFARELRVQPAMIEVSQHLADATTSLTRIQSAYRKESARRVAAEARQLADALRDFHCDRDDRVLLLEGDPVRVGSEEPQHFAYVVVPHIVAAEVSTLRR